MTNHTRESLARDFNSEVIVPQLWQPPRFEKADWMWIKNIAQAGPDLDSRIRDVRIGSGESARRLTCQHRTQPRRNFAVFYRRLLEDMILVIGLGSHNVNNKQYSVQWADGTKNRITLSSTQSSGTHFLVNPIGGLFGFRTMDALINETWLAA